MYTHKDFHLTCDMLLHYFVKIQNPKMLLILTVPVRESAGPPVRGAAGPRVYLYTPVHGPGSKIMPVLLPAAGTLSMSIIVFKNIFLLGRGLRPLPRPLPAPHHLTAITNPNPNPKYTLQP